jgi:putative cell wall-binding protein
MIVHHKIAIVLHGWHYKSGSTHREALQGPVAIVIQNTSNQNGIQVNLHGIFKTTNLPFITGERMQMMHFVSAIMITMQLTGIW